MADKKDTRRNLVVIEEGTLAALAGNPQVVKEFPFLAGLGSKKAKPGCGTCAQRSAARSSAYGAIKKAVAGLASDKKRRLKELLNARQARVTFVENGKVKQLTF